MIGRLPATGTIRDLGTCVHSHSENIPRLWFRHYHNWGTPSNSWISFDISKVLQVSGLEMQEIEVSWCMKSHFCFPRKSPWNQMHFQRFHLCRSIIDESDSPDIFEPKEQRQKLLGLILLADFYRPANHCIQSCVKLCLPQLVSNRVIIV